VTNKINLNRKNNNPQMCKGDRYGFISKVRLKRQFLNKVTATTYSIKDTKAASDCIDYILEHEAEDYYEQAAEHGITNAN